MDIAEQELRTLTMDHHGLVASVCHDLGLSDKINKRLDKGDNRRIISAGKAVVAMILNSLVFTNRRLYLTHQFFSNKPVERLLNEDIKSSDITRYTLGLVMFLHFSLIVKKYAKKTLTNICTIYFSMPSSLLRPILFFTCTLDVGLYWLPLIRWNNLIILRKEYSQE